jgi:hypothetical protein
MAKPSGKKRSLCEFLGQKDTKLFPTLQFEALPNEVILHVLSYLKTVDLSICGQVSKRFRAISNDENLWPKKFNLCHKKVPVEFLRKLLDRGCKYLSLSGASLDGTLNLPKASRIKYLNLSGFRNRENSEKLLGSTYSLEKLSLSHLHLSSKLISSVSLQNGKTLMVLDLSHCSLCTDEASWYCTPKVQQIVENCTELMELNLHLTKLCEKSVDILCFSLTSKIKKLNLFGIDFLKDNHVKKLVTRCNKITELNLGGPTTLITKKSVNFITEHLQSTLVMLDLGSSNIRFDSSDILRMKRMEKLTYLCYDHYSKWLTKQLPNNLWIHSSEPENKTIASPCHPKLHQHQGFWEIKAERVELFSFRF